jgi:hypothetical protein
MHHDWVNGIGIRKVVLVERRKILKHRFSEKSSDSEMRVVLRNYVGNSTA